MEVYSFCLSLKISAFMSKKKKNYFHTMFIHFYFSSSLFSSNSAENGGVFSMIGQSKFTTQNCIFKTNNATIGGTIFIEKDGATKINNSTFLENYSKNEGGVIQCIEKCQIYILNKTYMIDNYAVNQGGVGSLYYSIISISDSVFLRNKGELPKKNSFLKNFY